MKYVILTLSLFLVGCGPARITFVPENLDKGKEICEANGGVKTFQVRTDDFGQVADSVMITCNNGVQFFDRIKK